MTLKRLTGLRALMGRAALIPRDRGGEPWLAGLVSVLCFLACLAGVATSAADRAAQGWGRELRGEATVIVRPGAGETSAGAAARAAEALAGVRGVQEATALDRKAAEDLLRPWVGEAALADLPIPQMVTVRLDPDAPAAAPSLSRALAQAGLDADVDDHSLWRGEVERSAGTIALLAGLAFLLTAAAAAAAIAYATRAGMAAHGPLIATLSLNGATDTAIAGLYQRRFGLLALGAGTAGSLAAAVTITGLRLVGGGEGLTPALPLSWSDLLLISPCPLAAATVAVVAARLTALRGLSRLHGRT